MTIKKVYFMLYANDMDRAVAFYTQAFGLTPRVTSPGWSELAWGDATLALHAGGSADTTVTGLGFDTDDAKATCAAVLAAGGSVLEEPAARGGEGILLATVQDTEGNRFSISQSVR